MWTCPKCSRSFKSANQWHSCLSVEIAGHFINKPEVIREIYEKLISVVEKIGEVKVTAVKSAIFLKKESTYLEIKPKKDCLMIAFYLDTEISDFPISKAVKISKNRIAHVMHLQTPDDITGQVVEWLKRSYRLIS